MSWVLDSSAVIAWLLDEDGGPRVAAVMAEPTPIAIHAVNLVEVLYFFDRRAASHAIALEALRRGGVELVHGIDDEMIALAAQLKAHHTPIALGDVFAVALAAQRQWTLLTADRGELTKIADAGICPVEFLR